MNYRVLHMLEQAGFKFTPDVMHKLPLFEKLVELERERILDMCKEGLWDGEGIRSHLEKRDRGGRDDRPL